MLREGEELDPVVAVAARGRAGKGQAAKERAVEGLVVGGRVAKERAVDDRDNSAVAYMLDPGVVVASALERRLLLLGGVVRARARAGLVKTRGSLSGCPGKKIL